MKQRQLKNNLKETKPFKPPLGEFSRYLKKIWKSDQITNRGYYTHLFENKLSEYLNVDNVSLFSSGTLALTLALKALNLKGEVITTPFTHVSTIQSIYWNNLKPVFVDIDSTTFNIDVQKIEEAIGTDTCAILAVHVFGYPCNVEAIEEIAKKYNLKVIYDAAHCFGVNYKDKSIGMYGDLSILSFHATKVFNTIEGGAVICKSKRQKEYLDALSNSGIDNEFNLIGYGLNAKMNELQSVYGIILLKYIDDAIEKRKEATKFYLTLLNKIEGIKTFGALLNTKHNYSYFPIIIDTELLGVSMDSIVDFLEKNNIFTKRYFYPLISEYTQFKFYRKEDLSNAKSISSKVLCLPLSHEISKEDIEFVVNTISQITTIKIN